MLKVKRRDRWTYRWRRATSWQRRLPDFLIVGAQKCGTTSLFHYLAEHPQVTPPLSSYKELHFFDQSYQLGLGYYRSHFPLRRPRVSAIERSLTFEATPSYMYYGWVARRMLHDLPDAKFLVVLRDPVERAWSAYRQFERVEAERAGRVVRSFREAIEREISQIGAGERPSLCETPRPELVSAATGYVDRGLYADQIERLVASHGRDRVHVVIFEELCAEPQRELDRVLTFLELQPYRWSRFARHNASHQPVQTMADEDRETLREFYAAFQPARASVRVLHGATSGTRGLAPNG